MQTEPKIEHIDITPDRSIILKLGQSGYTIPESIAELVDNSIDASRDGGVDVNIEIDNGEIFVKDNGTGMDKYVASNCIRLGFSQKESRSKLGKFGLGLKTACLSLGRKFEIKTKNHLSDEEYQLLYDQDQWIQEGSWNKFPMKIVSQSSLDAGTVVKISDLLVKPDEAIVEKMRREFGIRFGPFIESNALNLFINGKKCEPEKPILTGEGKRNFELKLPSGEKIHGWFGFKISGSLKDYFGFNTYRLNRLITSYDKVGISAAQKAKQIVGEIHMGHVPVTHNKRQWVVESSEYKEVENSLAKFMRDFDMRMKPLVTGLSAHPGRVEGIARVMSLNADVPVDEIESIKSGDILVTIMTRPQFLLQIRRAGAIVTDQGGMLCHAAIVSREFGIPAVVGTQNATEAIKNGQRIIVDANEGVVYAAE